MRRNKALLACLCIGLFLVGLMALISSSAGVRASANGIIVEYADSAWTSIFEHSADLADVAKSVTPRVAAEYSNSIFRAGLYSSEDLNQAASTVLPRVIAEYGNSVFRADLSKSDELDQAAGAVTPRIVVEYANSIFTASSQRPPFLPPIRHIYLPLICKGSL